MATSKKKVQEKKPAEAPKPVAGAKPEKPAETPRMPEKAAPALEATKKGSPLKTAAVVLLLIIAVALAYYFLNQSSTAFVPGTSVDADTFKTEFNSASNIFIVMDVRGVSDSTVSNNILQCGVDFAGSSGMGGKAVTPISFGNDGCVAPDGKRDASQCFSMLQNGLTIYVKQGPGGVDYYSNGMVVTVGSNYTVGKCGISRF
jgi:hypothetical protein